ncbi:hypothetical protein CEW89_09485 [Celeribacter ethanolicus]|uniref:Integrase catalytic domain-containing protein n=1 Tax=Celeribacter ethanolicus TaxID=1758178 RepID=A0A291GC48_9RHOB|nr:integrase core domain-containing protein [Celeribacter ethanolicus]ATG47775.1 hypothetical protein CEW89_09485 [Celeribacter ethanolicus]
MKRLAIRDFDSLTASQLADVGRLETPSQQVEFGGPFRNSLDLITSDQGETLRGYGLLKSERVIGLVILKRPPSSPDWVPQDAVSLHGLKIDWRWQGYVSKCAQPAPNWTSSSHCWGIAGRCCVKLIPRFSEMVVRLSSVILTRALIYLEEITDGFQARRIVKNWMAFYNAERPHSALDQRTPDEAYWAGLEERHAA